MRALRGPARIAFWGCRACKAARDEATKEAREARRGDTENEEIGTTGHRRQEDREPPQASLHVGARAEWQLACAGNKEEARYFMRKVEKHTARATARVEREAPESPRFCPFTVIRQNI